MGHGPATFKETDLTRALRAARKAGFDVERAEIARGRSDRPSVEEWRRGIPRG
jgi:hypothetical protein